MLSDVVSQIQGAIVMSIQSSAPKLPWHRPLIVDDIRKSPPAGQLSLSPGTFKWFNRDEEKAELNKDAQARWRANDKKGRACYTVACDGDVLNMLVGTGHILDH